MNTKRMRTIAVFLIISARLFSQSDQMLEEIASSLYDQSDDSDMEHLVDYISELTAQALDINNATESRLQQCGLFSPFQVFGILKYREKYGPFMSVYELSAIPGFNTEMLSLIAPLITVNGVAPIKKTKNKQGFILANTQIKLPLSQAYSKSEIAPPIYPGPAIKVSGRQKYELGQHWQIGIAYEKDPGETFLLNKMPEHLTAYAAYKGSNFVRQIILGNFRLHRGMGIVHGLGFNSLKSGVQLNGFRRSYAKPFASLMEYDYYQGLYLECGLRSWRMDAFVSWQAVDLSFFKIRDEVDLFNMKRQSGLHRTSSEINGSGMGKQTTSGFSLTRAFGHVNLGITSTIAKIDLTEKAKDSLAFLLPSTIHSNLSVFGVAFASNFESFFEAATDANFRKAFIFGSKYVINPAFSLQLSYRRYQDNFQSQSPKAYGLSGDPQNQSGINIGCIVVPFHDASIVLNTDISHELNVLSSDYIPGYKVLNYIKFSYNLNSGTSLDVRANRTEVNSMKTDERTINVRYVSENNTHIRFQISNKLSESLKLNSRIELSGLTSGGSESISNIMYTQCTYTSVKKTSITYRFLLFNVKEWSDRIYTYEPGLRYSFSFPAWYGKGSRNVLVTKFKINRWLILRTKLGMSIFSNTKSTGSGTDTRPGSKVWDLELQAQVDF